MLPRSQSRRFGALLALSMLALAACGLSTAAAAPVTPAAGTTPAVTPTGTTPVSPVRPLHADTRPLDADAPAGSAAPTLFALAAGEDGAPAGTASGITHHVSGVEPFVAIGFSWRGPADLQARVEVELATGAVTPAQSLVADDDHDADGGTSGRHFTDPMALGQAATGFTVVVPATAEDVQVHYIREASAPTGPAASIEAAVADTFVPAATADGLPGPAGIRSRAAWGARERVYTDGCGDGSHREGTGCVADEGVVHAVVHHTVNPNDYSAAQVPLMLRSIQSFHMDVRGWDDIGYNFVVDRFGTVWEGRGGGPDRPVVGAHTEGFNTGSVGVSVLGTFDSTAPSAAILEGVAQVVAWKLAPRNVDPFGTSVLTSRGGDVHPAGEQVQVDNIAGHRQLGQTGCPGALLFAQLPAIRQRVAELLPRYTGEVASADRFSGQLRLSGFALQRDNAAPVPVRLEIDGATVATATANQFRIDVASRWAALGGNHGFEFVLPVSLSQQRACVFEQTSNTLIGCRDVNPVTHPFGDFSTAVGRTGPPTIDVGGWAIDPDTSEPTPLHVYVDGALAATLWTTVPRPDVKAAFPSYAGGGGFLGSIPTTLGNHQVCVYAINVPAGPHTSLGCRTVATGHTDLYAPVGSLDGVIPAFGTVIVAGWALDADTVDPILVHVYVDGAPPPTTVVADVDRPDIAAAFPASGGRHGFAAAVDMAPGAHDVCAYAINDNLVGPHTPLGCRRVNVPVPHATPPVGNLDVVRADGQAISVAGWAGDVDSPGPVFVHVYVDGANNPIVADGPRPDVGAALPALGTNRGFAGSISASPGRHEVCVYAINDNLVGPHTPLGCRSITVDLPNGTRPVGSLDVVNRTGGNVTVAGWAIDPDTPDPIAVHVYVGANGTPIVADGARPDLTAAFPGSGPAHGFVMNLPGTAGATVCVYAINDNPAAGHTQLGCRRV